MQRAIIIIYMVVSSAALLILNDALKTSEKNIESLEAILENHNDALKDHRDTLLLIIEDLKNKYI